MQFSGIYRSSSLPSTSTKPKPFGWLIKVPINAADKNTIPQINNILVRRERFSMIVISVGCGFWFSSSGCFVSLIKSMALIKFLLFHWNIELFTHQVKNHLFTFIILFHSIAPFAVSYSILNSYKKTLFYKSVLRYLKSLYLKQLKEV